MGESSKRKRKRNKKKKTTKAWEKVMSGFTDDLWIEIFLRLPIKSLLRNKSVSKSWFSIISSHRFAKSHLHTATKDDRVLIVHHDLRYFDEEEDGSFSLFHLGLGDVYKNLKFPYSDGEYSVEPRSKLIGSDCGIVCVSVELDKWPAAKKKCDIYLWNPETRHSKIIPPYTISDTRRRSTSTFGFGFDHVGFDFKVVRVVRRARSLVAEVYSSNKNVWRKIGSKPYNDAYSNIDFDLCYHGFLFGIERNSSMMAFDLNKEFFVWDINLPVASFDDGERYFQNRVVDYKDTIAVTITHMEEGRIQLWTLDDEACLRGGGVIASWTKVFTVDVGVPLNFVGGFFNNVQFALDDASQADGFLYDMNKKVTKYFPEHPYFETCEISKYTKSLFSLEGFKRIKWAASSVWDVGMDE